MAAAAHKTGLTWTSVFGQAGIAQIAPHFTIAGNRHWPEDAARAPRLSKPAGLPEAEYGDFGMSCRSIPHRAQNVGAGRIAWLASMILLTAAGCGRESSEPPSPTAGSQAGTDTIAAAPAAKEIDHKHPVVRIETNHGTISVRLDAVSAPGTVRNFLNYAGEGFYDNTLVHYVDPGKMILAGGYTADRQPKPARSPIRNEAHNGLKNVRGTIAMARDQALIDNATSQFFINLVDAPQRDHQGQAADQYGYCVFGEVIDGLDVADRISQSPTADMGADLMQTPEPPVLISSIRVVR